MRIEPDYLHDFHLSTTSSAEQSSKDIELDCEQYWHVYCKYTVLDVTTVNLKRWFSDDNLKLTKNVDWNLSV